MKTDENIEYIILNKDNKKINTNVILKKNEIYYFSGNENYWLFSSGKEEDLQKKFLDDEIIGLGWDKITSSEILTLSKDQLKEIFEQKYKFIKNERDYSEQSFKSYISSSVNKLTKFYFEIKLGDIIVLKDRGRNKILFGKVISEVEDYLNNDLKIDETVGYCNKIRKIKWLKEVEKDNIEAELKLVFNSRHAFSCLNGNLKAIEEINRQMFSFFYRGENLHMVFHVKKTGNIIFDDFKEFQDVIYNLKEQAIKDNSYKNEFNVKTNVQSPGPIEFFGNPEIINYIFNAIIVVGTFRSGVLLTKYYSSRQKLKLKEPQKDDESIFGN